MPPSRRRLTRSLIRSLAGSAGCTLAAVACLRLAWWLVFDIKVGPVVAAITGSHGVHSGDLFGVAYLAAGLAFGTWASVLGGKARRRALSLLAVR